MMAHPFLALPADRRKPVFWLLLIFTLLLMVVMNGIGAILLTPQAPYGIVSFELAGSVQLAQDIIASWGLDAQLHAAFSLGLDYLFMLAYSSAIGLACIWGRDVLARLGWPLPGLGLPLAWGSWLAALSDAVENAALWQELTDPVKAPWPQIAFWCAAVKFGLILMGLIYAFFALAVYFVEKRRLNSAS